MDKSRRSPKKGKTTYTYDVLNRLESVNEATGRAISYEFDGAGNRLKEIITENGVMATTTYNYNEQNRLVSKVTIGGAKGLITYSYDNNGNLIKEESGITKNYSYDELNQLIENSDGKKTTKSFYNGEGKRVGKEADGARTSFLYERDKVVLEVNATGEATARNIYGNTLIQRKVNGKLYEYLYNGHGDVTALVDETSNIAATYYYDSFGNHLETTGAVDNPIRYGGYRFDEDSNLYYLNSRMYDSENGRFLQEDSYRGDRKDPLSLNLYTYCHNEPIM